MIFFFYENLRRCPRLVMNHAPLARDSGKAWAGSGSEPVSMVLGRGWFERVASPAMVQSIYKFKTDALSVSNDFVPIVD